MRLMSLMFVAPACLTLSQAPVAAEETPGGSLMQEGAKLFLRGLMAQAEPMLDEMEQAFREMEPALREMGPKLKQLVDLMGDIENYDAPERMPNGDILIRRKAGAPPVPALPDLSLPPNALPAPRRPETGRLIPESEIEL